MATEDLLNRAIKGIAKVLDAVQEPQYRGPTIDFYQPKGGQLQFSVAPPRYRETEKSNVSDPGVKWASKMGAVFVEAAPPDPENPGRLAWGTKKIVFAMSDKDIGQILWALELKKTEVSLNHYPDENNKQNGKTFKISKGQPNRQGEPTWNLSLLEKRDGEQNRVSVFVGGPDMMRLKTLLEHSLPFIMGCHKI